MYHSFLKANSDHLDLDQMTIFTLSIKTDRHGQQSAPRSDTTKCAKAIVSVLLVIHPVIVLETRAGRQVENGLA